MTRSLGAGSTAALRCILAKGRAISLADPFNPRLSAAVRQRASIDLFVGGVAFIAVLAVAAFSPRVFIDGDTNWHVAAGRWILAHHTVPQTDPFSYTYAGKPWVAHEWGAEVLMTLAYYAGAWSGVVLLIGLAAGAAYAMIAAELRLWMGPVGQAIGLALSFACLEPFLFARPHILALPLLVYWTRRLLAARREGRAPSFALAPLMIVWANLHASFIFGLAIIGPFALEALVDFGGQVSRTWAEERAAARREARAPKGLDWAVRQAAATSPQGFRALFGWAAFGLLSLAFSLATPHGFTGLTFPFMVLGMRVLPNILEWRGATFGEPTWFEASLIATLFLGLWRGIRVPVFRLILVVALVHMALQHIRQEAILAALAPLLLAEPFGHALRPDRVGVRTANAGGWRPSWRVPSVAVAATLVLFGAVVVGTRLAIPLVRRDNANVPVSAMAHVPAALLSQPMFNEYAFGGYLIFKGVKPYIDGRADMYGDAWVQEYLAIDGGAQPDVDQALKRWNIRWTILSPRDGLVGLLDARPDWKRLYADPYAVVQARIDPPAGVAAANAMPVNATAPTAAEAGPSAVANSAPNAAKEK